MGTRRTVAVVIPCRNMGRYLGQALDSVFAQERLPDEVVVVDDGSTDDTSTVARSRGDRVRCLDGPGQGSAVARNLGILATTSEFVAFLDADDYWRPGHLEAAVAALEEPRFGLSCSDWQHEADGRIGPALFGTYYSVVTHGRAFSALLRENWILTSSVVVRRSALAQSGLFEPRLRGGQDFELWLRLARTTEFACVRTVTAIKRDHANNITGSPEYPFHRVALWRTVLARHSDVAGADLAQMRRRAASYAHGAGRHALRLRQFAAARSYLAEACRLAPLDRRYRAWQALATLPAPVLEAMLRARQGARPPNAVSAPGT